MLSAIEERLRRFAEEVRVAKDKAKIEGAKTIGVLVDPVLYARLKRLAEHRNLSMKAAVLLAAEEGLKRLGF